MGGCSALVLLSFPGVCAPMYLFLPWRNALVFLSFSFAFCGAQGRVVNFWRAIWLGHIMGDYRLARILDGYEMWLIIFHNPLCGTSTRSVRLQKWLPISICPRVECASMTPTKRNTITIPDQPETIGIYIIQTNRYLLSTAGTVCFNKHQITTHDEARDKLDHPVYKSPRRDHSNSHSPSFPTKVTLFMTQPAQPNPTKSRAPRPYDAKKKKKKNSP
jgi:hypothetical protein